MLRGKHRQRANFQIPVGAFDNLELAHLLNLLNPFAHVSVAHASLSALSIVPEVRVSIRLCKHALQLLELTF
jgi:hypothetical protein